MKLLIIDDSSIMRRKIEEILAVYNLEIVGSANNGKEAIDLFKEKLPDIVTLDITMPGMDGISCLEQMMAIKPDTKVIMITALSDKLTGLLAIDKGARGFIHKPITEEKLTKVVSKFI